MMFELPDVKTPTQKCFIVLGVHRSATSLVAKALATQIDMGSNGMPILPDNPKGHWENWDFVSLNEAIIISAGGTWDHPPSEEAILAQKDKFNDSIKAMVDKYSKGRELWGVKDPRMTLTIKLYLPYLHHPHFICCFREPIEAAKSLVRRSGSMLLEDAVKMVDEYNNRMLSFISYFIKQKGCTFNA